MRERYSLLIFLFVFCPVMAFAAALTGVRTSSDRIVFEFDGDVSYQTFTLSNPERIVIDFKNTQLKTKTNPSLFTKTPVKAMRTAPRNKTDLRVVLDMRQKATPKMFALAANQDYPERVVLDLASKPTPKPTPKPIATAKPKTTVSKMTVETIPPKNLRRDVVVVIDPGHGGKDPGATGRGGIHEKDIVLDIAKRLKVMIDKEPGMTAVLTRTGDYYIPLRDRMALARKDKADLFMSVHADAFRDSRARGASVYALSAGGATSEAARWLAEKENQSEVLGEVNMSGMDHTLRSVLLDLSQTASISSSIQLGKDVLGQLQRVARLHRDRVEQAGFVVLKAPDVTSVLVETGFVSNVQEARLLSTSAYRAKIAGALHRGIVQYFDQKPPPGTFLALRHQSRRHVVRSGETLSGIADRYGIPLSQLKRANKLFSSQIMSGQTLYIPARSS